MNEETIKKLSELIQKLDPNNEIFNETKDLIIEYSNEEKNK